MTTESRDPANLARTAVELAARCTAAPWSAVCDSLTCEVFAGEDSVADCSDLDDSDQGDNNARFIAFARNHVEEIARALLAANERVATLEALLRRALPFIGYARSDYNHLEREGTALLAAIDEALGAIAKKEGTPTR